jgi:hypothetical protein
VHSTLQAVNSTLADIAANELQISENQNTKQKQMNETGEKRQTKRFRKPLF